MKDNKDCAMYLGIKTKHCSGWTFETCENCRHAKLKSDGWYMEKSSKYIMRKGAK